MYTTQLENETLDDYAIKPKMTYAEYPSVYEQRRYIFQSVIDAVFVTATVLIFFAVS
ncbi:MAG: ssl1498 family light-harvesting-like protein [Xenococcus sp. MO_188.B8]|nr:ssl1498 family light-harvesting-like protein [Xenococcus sp. MO_188.B8]